MTCPGGPVDARPRAEGRRESVVGPKPASPWLRGTDHGFPPAGVDRRLSNGPPRAHGDTAHVTRAERPRSDAPRVWIWSDGRGRSPGSRVVACLPPSRRRERRQWLCGRRLTAHSCGGSPGFGFAALTPGLASPMFPFHPSRDGTTSRRVDCSRGTRRVNGLAAAIG